MWCCVLRVYSVLPAWPGCTRAKGRGQRYSACPLCFVSKRYIPGRSLAPPKLEHRFRPPSCHSTPSPNLTTPKHNWHSTFFVNIDPAPSFLRSSLIRLPVFRYHLPCRRQTIADKGTKLQGSMKSTRRRPFKPQGLGHLCSPIDIDIDARVNHAFFPGCFRIRPLYGNCLFLAPAPLSGKSSSPLRRRHHVHHPRGRRLRWTIRTQRLTPSLDEANRSSYN